MFLPVRRNIKEVPAGGCRAPRGHQTVRGARHQWPWHHRAGHADHGSGARSAP